jgi:hypothetical protein
MARKYRHSLTPQNRDFGLILGGRVAVPQENVLPLEGR